MLPVSVSEISRVMSLKKDVRDLEHLMAAIEAGLPKQALSAVLGYFSGQEVFSRSELLGKIVSLATFKRRQRLKPAEGEKVARLARLIAYARFVWDGDDAAVREFFISPHPLLERRRPLDLAFSDLGAMKVERILTNILHGLPA
jgi:putative toxin-antitoxin system antitoxin component (TIGR02293 family)